MGKFRDSGGDHDLVQLIGMHKFIVNPQSPQQAAATHATTVTIFPGNMGKRGFLHKKRFTNVGIITDVKIMDFLVLLCSRVSLVHDWVNCLQ